MGTDIWSWALRHQSDNSWKVVETYSEPKYPCYVYDYDNDKETDEVMCDQVYDGRSYALFGLLAEVRADGDDSFTEVRGLPEDCPELLLRYFGGKNSDFHSPTWYNLVELRAFNLYLKGQMNIAKREIDYKLKYDPDYSIEDANYDRENCWETEQYMAMRSFYESVIRFLYAAGEKDVESHLEDYRVVLWFDS